MLNEDWQWLADALPWFVREVRHVHWAEDSTLVPVLQQRGVAAHACGAAGCGTEGPAIDALVCTGPEDLAALGEALAQSIPQLKPHGLCIVACARGTELPALLSTAGLREYPVRYDREPSRYTTIDIHKKSEDPLHGRGVMAVHADYDPFEHAHALFDSGFPEAAFQVLDGVPVAYLEDPTCALRLALERQIALLAWKRDRPPKPLLKRFYWAQKLFYDVMNMQPRYVPAYVCQAKFWCLVGRPEMARRWLGSVHHANPDALAEQHLAALPTGPARIETPTAEPPWDAAFRPRVLLINHANCDCALDMLYDGLCRVLGADNVTEYPYKAFLHGAPIDENIHHPSACNHAGRVWNVAEIEASLRAGEFDAVVYSDVYELLEREAVLRLAHANPALPWVLYDTRDEGWDMLGDVREYLDGHGVVAQFKREMLAGSDYGPRCFPLPLAYSDGRVPNAVDGPRDRDVFWAGHRHFGLRRLYLDYLEERLGRSFDQIYEPEEYAEALGRARIGLDFYGLGYDTVRYYELAAHGCMLLAERKPIVIPNNFRDGVHAVLFDDLPDLEAKLRYYLEHEDEAAAIARAGHAHMRRHHTASARAKQFLARLHDLLPTEAS